MHSKIILNLANSGKSTSLLFYDRLNLASKAPHMTDLYARPLLRVLKYSCCAKLTTLLWRALMKTSPSVYMIRSVKPYNYHLKIPPHSSTSASSKTSTAPTKELLLITVTSTMLKRLRSQGPCIIPPPSTVSQSRRTLARDAQLVVFRPGQPHPCSSSPSRPLAYTTRL